jgi:RecB family exonuclease
MGFDFIDERLEGWAEQNQEPEKPVFSSSEELAFKTCRLAHYFAYVLGYAPKLTNSKLSVGIAVHAALEVFYLGGGLADMEARVDRYAAERWEEIAAAGLKDDTETHLHYLNDTALVKAMVLGYPDWAAEEGVDEGWKVEAVEDSWLMEVPGAPCLMPVKLDLLQRHESTGELRVVDFKTAKAFKTSTTPYLLSEQNGNYQLSVTARYGERPTQLAYRELRKIVPSNRSKPPYYREVPVMLTAEELVARAEEYVRVATERFSDPVVYANPSACCGSWKDDWAAPCLLVHQGHDPEEALELTGAFQVTDPYKRYEEDEE